MTSRFFCRMTLGWALVVAESFAAEPPALKPHPDAVANTHPPGEVDRPEMVRWIVADPRSLPGIVVDETAAKLQGAWQYSTHTPPYVGLGYLHDQKSDKGAKSVTFVPELPHEGRYEVRMAHCYNVRRATNTPITIRHADGETTLRINQQEEPPHGRLFRSLGTFRFQAGRTGWVRIATDGTDGKYVIADAVQWLPERKQPRPNVLFLIADDLATTLGCYGGPYPAQTPTLDRLAARSVLFERAYCQFPHCNPSRSSLLTGWRPDVTRVTNNEDNLYRNHPDVVTMPRYFRAHGYRTARCGKIFHLGVPSGTESMDDPHAWDFGTPFRDERPYPPARPSRVKVATGKGSGLAWNESTGGDDDLVDGQFAARAIAWLEQHPRNQPFFLAVGFHRPHLPLVAPAPDFDRYDIDRIRLPFAPADDEADIPLPARNGAVSGYALSTTPEQRRAAIRAYLACVSHVDAQVARLLAALDRLELSEKTIVVFTSDHGWHLGEHGLWHKRSLFEESARVPLLISSPQAKANGKRAAGLVELLDLYPTLCDLTGLPIPRDLQGKSLRPMLDDASLALHEAVFTQARRGAEQKHWGRSVRTARWRYTEWDEGRSGTELYDHELDPQEYTNLADRAEHQATIVALKAKLQKVRGAP